MKNILTAVIPLMMITALGCGTPGVRVANTPPLPTHPAAISNKVQQLEKRIDKLEKAQAKSRATDLRKRFETRARNDRKIYSPEELREIEDLYRAENKPWDSVEKRESLETLIDRFPEANRAGCAILYLGQMTDGQAREAYLRRAIAEFGDCWYGDGVQVGAYARFYLAWDCEKTGKAAEAERLFGELRKEYPDAVNHKGLLLLDRLPDPANANRLTGDTQKKRSL